MKCPHCLVSFHEQLNNAALRQDEDYVWSAAHTLCPACKKLVVYLVKHYPGGMYSGSFMVHPRGISRTPLPADVPDLYAQDYKEACLVLPDSPKASAALSRRCLQNILRAIPKVKPSDLSKEIDEILNSKQLPSHLADAIDAIRVLGNFAAHPMKSTNTGAIVEVEEGESEWLLDVLEGLFDFYFVQPAILQRKRDLLNKKLQDAGKPPLK
jgi:uncharacterized protein DUF4145